MPGDAAAAVDAVYRSDWGRIVATLIRLVGDFDVAEEAAQEAFTAAVGQWEDSGVPQFPRAWIIQTARHKAIDRIRRQARFAEKLETYAASELETTGEPEIETGEIPDDLLRLIFTCCHPALALETQVALTLRTVAGLETDEIARAFLVPPATAGQGAHHQWFSRRPPWLPGSLESLDGSIRFGLAGPTYAAGALNWRTL